MARHLIIVLEAPMMSFGDVAIDNIAATGAHPMKSQLTGMIGNALGYRRTDREQLQNIQDRLVFASAVVREPAGGWHMTDFQTAQLGAGDRGWTTRGEPEGRAGGARTYDAPHLRFRDYYADMSVAVALRLHEPDVRPTLDDVASALDTPFRPLFIGRKGCPPSGRLTRGFREAPTALDALSAHAADGGVPEGAHVGLFTFLYDPDLAEAASVRACWPPGEGGAAGSVQNKIRTTDQRNWRSGLHGGSRLLHQGLMAVAAREQT